MQIAALPERATSGAEEAADDSKAPVGPLGLPCIPGNSCQKHAVLSGKHKGTRSQSVDWKIQLSQCST